MTIFNNRLSRFIGLNTVDDPTRVATVQVETDEGTKTAYPLVQASNVSIDNSFSVSSRGGYTSKVTGTDIHSLWSNGSACLFVDGTTLYRLGFDYSKVAICSGLMESARMSYASWNDKVYHTNGHQISYFQADADHDLVDPGLQFKLPLPPGQLIEYFMGRLYVAANDVLYISDPLCDYFDIRHGYKLFPSRISMLRAVDKGIYASDNQVCFLAGDSPEDFLRRVVHDARPIPFTDMQILGSKIKDNVPGNVAIWTSEEGICVGDNSGNVVNLTHDRYLMTPSGDGSCLLREAGQITHYINTLF